MGEGDKEGMQKGNEGPMLKILKLYLERVMRGRQGLVDLWNKTLKLDSLGKCHLFKWKLTSFPFFIPFSLAGGWCAGSFTCEVWNMAEKLQSICCAGFGQLTMSVSPDMQKVSICYILSTESDQQLSVCSLKTFPWLFFHRTPWEMILEYS